MTTDAELLAAAGSDARAFRRLYHRYAVPIHRFHRGRTGDVDAALDLTAETFAQAWLSRGRFRDRAAGSAGPWLFAIARNVLVTSVRRRRLEQAARERLGVLVEREPREASDDWLDGLDEALEALAPDLREAVELRVVDDLTYDELAARSGTTAGAARVRVHRGLKALRERLTREEAAG
jgi:RNA polymerase sigma-70 factor, ECF subfamily